MQAQTTTAMSTTAAELLAQYNAITVYDTQEGKDLARAIIQGDTSGKVPAKKEQILMDDCEGEYFIPAILATKPGKLTPAQAVAPLASRDELRPAMMCVYYDATRGAVVATCGHVLMSFPCGPLAPASGLLHPVTLEPLKVGDVVNKQVMSKDAVDTRYPDYVNVIRLPNPNGPAVTLDVQSFRNQLAGIARAQRFVNLYTGIRARIQHEGQDFYVDAALCGEVLRAMQASGTTRINLDLSTPTRPLQFTDVNDAKKLALIMPVYRPDREVDGDGFAYCTVLDTSVGQVLTNPASVKRVTVKKPVQPRAVQVLSKEEKKSLAAHVKQYEEAPERQVEMMGQVQDSIATHLTHLRQATFRQLTSKEIHNLLVSDALFLARVGRAFLATVVPAPPTVAPTIADLAAANVAHETAVLDAVAELGDMTWSDAQALVDFGGFDYMQCLAKGLTPAETATVLLKDTAPTTPIPAPKLTPPAPAPQPARKRKFPFTSLRLAGHRVALLHQVGKCAVARVFPCEGRAPYYAARFRQHTVQFGHLHEAEQALLTLRRMDNAEIRRDNEVFTLTDALDQLDLRPPCLDRFCILHGLKVERSYTRRELRRAITDRREPKMPVYLSLLNRLTVTNPVQTK